jgi:Fe-S-cluster containining protein
MREEPFSCTLCGRCCMGSGRYIAVLKQTGPREYRCRETITRREFTARVEDRHLSLFARPSVQWTHPAACPFLRQDGETYLCTIRASRPPFCREYRCVRMRVEKGAAAVGELRGKTGLKTKDAALLALWEGRIAHLDLQDREGRAEAARILEGAGYDPVWYVEAEDLTGTAPPS